MSAESPGSGHALLTQRTTAEGESVTAIAVRELLHKEIVAHQQGRLHRGGGDIEGLKQEGADYDCDRARVDYGLGEFQPGFAGFGLGAAIGHTTGLLFRGATGQKRQAALSVKAKIVKTEA